MPTEKTVTIKVFRYDPQTDDCPKYSAYDIQITPGQTKILGALQYIRNYKDGGLAFRYGCKSGLCGLCGVQMNGTPVLACMTSLEESCVIEPLAGFQILKDLVVDREAGSRQVFDVRRFLHRSNVPKAFPEPLVTQSYKEYKMLNQCIECLICDSVCPVFKLAHDEYAGPFAFVELSKRLYDPRDTADRTTIAVSEGLFLCLHCRKCEDVCPNEIPILGLAIQGLREKAVVQGRAIPDIYRKLYSNIRKTGCAYKIPVLRLKKREKQGLPLLPKTNLNDVTKLLGTRCFLRRLKRAST